MYYPLSSIKTKYLEATPSFYSAIKEQDLPQKVTPRYVAERILEVASDKGASGWLAALPLMSEGFALNAYDFRDALAMRYG